MVNLTIDHKKVQVPEGTTILKLPPLPALRSQRSAF